MLDPYEVYTCYCALKAHFNSSYDYHKYKGKIKNIKSKQDFERSNYKFLFTKYCKFTKNTLESIFVSNFLKNKNFWAGDYEIAINNQKSHLSTTDSLSYVFLNELNFLNSDLSKNISVETGSHPYLLKLYLSKKISLETLIIILDSLKIKDYWNNFLKEDIVWKDIDFLIEKYRPFFVYDKQKYKKKFIDYCKEIKYNNI